MFDHLQTVIPIDSIFTEPTANSSFGELIKDGHYEQILDNIVTWGINVAIKLLIALLIFFVGRFLISKLDTLIGKLLKRSRWDDVLKGFIRSFIQTALFIVLFMLIINAVGVKTVSIAAIIAAVGLAIGLAMKDNLANFAGGVMILLSKPFRGGDYIIAQNLEGTVESIGILHTILKTKENKRIYIPNGPLSTGSIINNNSPNGILRTEIIVNVDLGSNIDEVKAMLLNIAHEHPKALKQTEPSVAMTKINISRVEFTLWVWADKSDLRKLKHGLTETIYKEFYKRGIIPPFKQISLHQSKNRLE